MMQARVGDFGIGICPAHLIPLVYVTFFVTGSPTVLVNGMPAAFASSMGISSCGHITMALTGSSKVLINSKPAHRSADTGMNMGMYTAMIGSATVISG